MRILATRENEDNLPVFDLATGSLFLEENGLLPGVPLPDGDSINQRWDPREGFKGDINHGWIGEREDGLWIAIHPEIAALSDPLVHAVATRFRSCSDREIQFSDYDRLSNFELKLWLEGLAAERRKNAPDKNGETTA